MLYVHVNMYIHLCSLINNNVLLLANKIENDLKNLLSTILSCIYIALIMLSKITSTRCTPNMSKSSSQCLLHQFTISRRGGLLLWLYVHFLSHTELSLWSDYHHGRLTVASCVNRTSWIHRWSAV